LEGLHAAAAGNSPDTSQELCSGNILLESLVACFGVTLRAVGTALAMPIASGTVTGEGDLDFRGTLGIGETQNPDTPVPVGFQAIRLVVRLEVGEECRDKVDTIALSERYCIVLQTSRAGVSVETTLGHGGNGVPDARKDSGSDDIWGKGEEKLADGEALQLN